MDGLALLCTLHADGPATLKRLRSAGCPNLTALLELPITDLALALDVAPAAARRLLREARLLAERVGPELEAEEAPAPAGALPVAATPVAATSGAVTKGAGPPASELPLASTLDQSDRALLERIVREGRAARPAVERVHGAGMASGVDRAPEAAPPGLAPAPTALERVGLDLSAEGPWPTTAPEAVCGVVQDARALAPGESAPRDAMPLAAGAELGPLLALEGFDAALAHDLVRAGIPTLEDLARADALSLARELQVTFAQAKRLCFLARRAAGSGARTVAQTATSPRATMRVELPIGTPPSTQPSPPTASWRIEPRSEPLVSAMEHPTAPVAARLPGPVDVPIADPVAGPRARFWEPRSGAGVDAPGSLCEPQGVPVDPSEVDRPRRISDVRRAASAHAADQSVGRSDARHAAPTPAAPRQVGPAEHLPTTGTILGWNFEIPRPEASVEAEPQPVQRTWRPLEADESSAGPFA